MKKFVIMIVHSSIFLISFLTTGLNAQNDSNSHLIFEECNGTIQCKNLWRQNNNLDKKNKAKAFINKTVQHQNTRIAALLKDIEEKNSITKNKKDAGYRYALIIGNSNYTYRKIRVDKSKTDAKALALSLKKLGFRVVLGLNSDFKSMKDLLNSLLVKLRPEDEIVFYFSGLGISLQGKSYLLPTDFSYPNFDHLNEFLGKSFSSNEIINMLQQSAARTKIFFFDAGQKDPFVEKYAPGNWKVWCARHHVKLLPGTFVLKTTSYGEEVVEKEGEDDSNPHSVFMRHFLPLLNKQGLSLVDIVKKIQIEFKKLSQSDSKLYKQTPSYNDKIIGHYYFSANRMEK